jgi:hypothetical protein
MNDFDAGPVKELDGNYYNWKLKDKSDKRVFIVFSSRGAEPGDFSFYKTFDKLDVNVLHITPPDFTWYQSGLVGLGDSLEISFDKLANKVVSFCEDFEAVKIFIVGASMGGYAAVLFSSMLSMAARVSYSPEVICFGTEMILKLPNSKSSELDFFVADRLKDIRHFDFVNVKINMIFGEFDLVDTYCALIMKEHPSFYLYSCSSSGHLVPEFLNKTVTIVEFFRSFISGGKSFIGRGHIDSEVNADDIYPLVFSKPFSEEYLSALNLCLKKYPAFGYGWNRLGVYHHNNSNLADASNCLKKSQLINSDFSNTTQHIASVRKKIEDSPSPK